ncbi:hypothetical protein EYZ11_004900 [Aspergillus tanneri]|uniref:G-patch domain-containing protein n=1 Tax=Aspergillus tanneri TaxID=1220188 RepID=A0A4S3JLS1_9EURO|nr:uncharacterized protein ATNIH1004_000511 [Aspergillus tanneri]KAA8651620.1 hypothetical protein ATNIH1004_000511 [Aspergillus tanneri]THC95638.1 hypothetical protein EYZ11_004900 [Aspergillus tanneri]
MDAQAYLLRHGWSGPGNPLNPNRRPGTHAGLGLTKPILVARRQGNEGVGKKTTKDPTNQWWLRGFEDALKGVGQANNAGARGGGPAPNALTSELYRFFVRGEVVPGTLGEGDKSAMKNADEAVEKSASKRKKESSSVDGEESEELREVKRARKEEKKRRRKIEKVKNGTDEIKESKEERRLRKEKNRKKEKEKRKIEDRSSCKEMKREKKEHNPEEDYPTPISMEQGSIELSGQGDSTDPKDLLKKDKKRKKQKASTTEENTKSKSKKSKDEKRTVRV